MNSQFVGSLRNYLLNYLFLKSKPLNYQLVKRFESDPTGIRTQIIRTGILHSIH